MFTTGIEAPIYLGTADNALQSNPSGAEERLAFEHNVLVTLGHTVLVGTPFIWQSRATLALVARNQPLLERGLPGLRLTSREGVATAGDYFAQRASDTRLFDSLELRPESPFLVEQPGAVPLDWRNVVGSTVQVVPRISSVEQRFRALIINDAEASVDGSTIRDLSARSLGARFSVRGRNRTDYVLTSLSERSLAGHFSRAIVEDEFLRHNADLTLLNAALRRTTALYQLACATAHGASLFTSSDVARRVPREHGYPVIEPWTISPANPYLFAHVLACVGVQPKAWARLEPLTLITLTQTANPLHAFVLRYKDAVTRRALNWLASGALPSFEDAVSVLRNDLLLGDRWRSLEIVSRLGRSRSAPYLAGAVGASVVASSTAGVALLGGQLVLGSAIGTGKAIKDIAKLAADVRDDIPFLDLLRMRGQLRSYLGMIGLTR